MEGNNMKRKILIAILSVMACLCGLMGVACKGSNVKVVGFNVAENIILERGSFYNVKVPLALDSIGNVLNVTYKVKDADGKLVNDDSAGFFVVDDNYTIEYTAQLFNGKTVTKKTNVTAMLFVKHGIHNEFVTESFDFKDLSNFPNSIPKGFEMEYDIVFGGNEVDEIVDEQNVFQAEGLADGMYDITAYCKDSKTSFKLFEINLDVCTDTSKPIWHYEEYMAASDLVVTGWRNEVLAKASVVDASTVDGGLFGKTEGNFYKAVQGNEDALAVNIKPSHIKALYEQEQFLGKDYKMKFEFLMTTTDGKWNDPERPPEVQIFGEKTTRKLGEAGLNTWHEAEVSYDAVIARFDKMSAYDKNQVVSGSLSSFLIHTFKGLASTKTADKSVIFYISPITIERIEKIVVDLDAPAWQTADTMRKEQIVTVGWRNEVSGKASIVEATESAPLFGKTEGKFYKAVQGGEDALNVNIAPVYEKSVLEEFIGQGYVIKFQWLLTTTDGIWHHDSNFPRVRVYGQSEVEIGVAGLGQWFTAEIDFDTFMANWDKLTAYDSSVVENPYGGLYFLHASRGLDYTIDADRSAIFYISEITVELPTQQA